MKRTTVGDVMTTRVVAVKKDASFKEMIIKMRVINSTRHLIGIVSRSDVLSIFARPDAEIRQEAVGQVIAESVMVDSQPLAVTVHDGVVTLTGHPDNEQPGRALAGRIRHIEGVVAVRDRLSYAGRPDDA